MWFQVHLVNGGESVEGVLVTLEAVQAKNHVQPPHVHDDAQKKDTNGQAVDVFDDKFSCGFANILKIM